MRRTQPGPRTGVYPHVARWSSGAFKQPPSAKSGFSFFLFDGCLGVAQSGRATVLQGADLRVAKFGPFEDDSGIRHCTSLAGANLEHASIYPGASFASANLEGAQLPSVRYDFADLIENPFIRTGVLALKLCLRCTRNSA